MARTLGAFELGEAALALEEAARHDQSVVGERLPAVLMQLSHLATELLLLDGPSAPAPAALDRARALASCRQLAAWLEQRDTAASAFLDTFRQDLAAAPQRILVHEIESATSRYDYAVALALLADLIAQLESGADRP